MRLNVVAMGIGIGLVSAMAMGGDWPQFRGPQSNGFAADTAVNTDWGQKAPKEIWRIALTDEGYGGPAVAGGNLYIIDHKGAQDIVRCIGLEEGRDVWTYPYDDAPKANFGCTRSTPTISDGRVYTVSMQGRVHCLDAKTGKLIWQLNMPADMGGQPGGWGYATSVLIDGENAILCPGGPGSSVVAVNRTTGKSVWKSGTDKAGYATPVIATLDGVKQYIVFSATSANGYAANDGKLLWTLPWKTAYDVNASSPLVTEKGVFISSGYGVGCAMISPKAASTQVLWKNKAMQQQFTSAIEYKGMIFGTTDPGDVVCLDPATGKETWRHGGFEKGGVVGVGDVMLALSGNDGDLVAVALDAGAYKELGRIKPLGGQSWVAPIVADGRMFVRNNQALVCLDAR